MRPPKRRFLVLCSLLCVIMFAACAADPAELTAEPTCLVTVNEAAAAAQLYEDGFDYDYDKLMSLTPGVAETYTITFDVSWETDVLTVSEAYFRAVGDVSQVTHTLRRDAGGQFSLQVSAPRSNMECAAYFISAGTDVFVSKIYFQPYHT